MAKQSIFKKTNEKSSRHEEYFMSANGGGGFRCYQDRILPSDKLDAMYILKGGPGTGKSTFMKRAAAAAVEAGAAVKLYWCSSDPSSLDAIHISHGDKKLGIIDGTAPHERDADIPGAVDRIIDLGRFWDANALAKSKDEISSLIKRKREAFARAYSYLSEAAHAQDMIGKIYASACLWEKLRRSSAAFVCDISEEKGAPREERVFISSYGTKGHINLNAPLEVPGALVSVRGADAACNIYLEEVRRLVASRTAATVFEDPLLQNRVCGIFLPFYSVALLPQYSIDDGYTSKICKTVNSERFFNLAELRSSRGELRMLRDVSKKYESVALGALADAGEYHLKLEEIYSRAMDFSAENEFLENFCADLVAALT